jgi:hypothetical protein
MNMLEEAPPHVTYKKREDLVFHAACSKEFSLREFVGLTLDGAGREA